MLLPDTVEILSQHGRVAFPCGLWYGVVGPFYFFCCFAFGFIFFSARWTEFEDISM